MRLEKLLPAAMRPGRGDGLGVEQLDEQGQPQPVLEREELARRMLARAVERPQEEVLEARRALGDAVARAMRRRDRLEHRIGGAERRQREEVAGQARMRHERREIVLRQDEARIGEERGHRRRGALRHALATRGPRLDAARRGIAAIAAAREATQHPAQFAKRPAMVARPGRALEALDLPGHARPPAPG